jgi:hypothetical protein
MAPQKKKKGAPLLEPLARAFLSELKAETAGDHRYPGAPPLMSSRGDAYEKLYAQLVKEKLIAKRSDRQEFRPEMYVIHDPIGEFLSDEQGPILIIWLPFAKMLRLCYDTYRHVALDEVHILKVIE